MSKFIQIGGKKNSKRSFWESGFLQWKIYNLWKEKISQYLAKALVHNQETMQNDKIYSTFLSNKNFFSDHKVINQ